MHRSQPSQPDPSPKGQTVRVLLGVVALTLVTAGQFVFYIVPRDKPYGLGWGLALSGVGILLFVLASLRQMPTWAGALAYRISIAPMAAWISMAIGLSSLTAITSAAFEKFGQASYLPVTFLWGSGAVCYILAFAQGRPAGNWRGWLRAHRRELLLVGGVTLAAAALRFYKLGAIPRIINGDEGELGQAALLTARLPLANPFALFENFGAAYLQAINLAFQIFGQNAFALRLLPAVGGTLAVPALYLLARRLFGSRLALLAAALLAISHTHLNFSRTVAVGYIQGTFLVPLELYLLISGLENRSLLRAALGGLILGLHFSVYLSAQVIAAYILVYLLIAAVVCRPLVQKALRPVAAFWGGAAVVALPLIAYSWQHPDEFLARLNADGTFQSGWLSRTMAETGQSAVQVLMERVAHAFLSLIYYPAIDFYGSPIPALSLITAALFLLGAGLALGRTRDHRYLLLNGYLWSATLAVGIFSMPPTADSYRMLIALPAAFLLAAVGFEQLLELATLNRPERRLARFGIIGFVLAGLLAMNLWTYFADFAGGCRYGGDPQTRFASYLGNYLGQVDRETEVYLLSNDVFRYGTHSSVDFLSHNMPITNVSDPIDTLNSVPHSVIIAPAPRADELKNWAYQHPGGNLHREYDCNTLMMLVYVSP